MLHDDGSRERVSMDATPCQPDFVPPAARRRNYAMSGSGPATNGRLVASGYGESPLPAPQARGGQVGQSTASLSSHSATTDAERPLVAWSRPLLAPSGTLVAAEYPAGPPGRMFLNAAATSSRGRMHRLAATEDGNGR